MDFKMIFDMANTLAGLLKGQTIRIDNHHRGVQNVWDDKYDIHLHKICNNKNVDYDIKINLNRKQDESVLDKLPSKIRKEVMKATSNPEILNNFYEGVYKYLSENFDWNDNNADKERIINNITTAFDMKPYKPYVDVTNAKTQKRDVIQMMRYDYKTLYQIVFNYSKESVYIGQFQLGNMTGIRIDVQKRWAETLERHLRDILTVPDTKAALNRIRIPGISDRVIENTLDAIERIYGDKPDFTDKETR